MALPPEEDLEALFEQIAATRGAGVPLDTPTAGAPERPDGTREPAGPEPAAYERIGMLTRKLHDALHELGYDKTVETAAQALPDARARLAYIAALTGKAAERALAAVEQGQAELQARNGDATLLAADWERLYAGALDVGAFKALAGRTRCFLGAQADHAARLNACLLEIMMAQDFHDLTGQVIQRIVALAQTLEDQLVKLLLETRPAGPRGDPNDQWLGGPSVHRGRSDVVGDQGQVDQLLESLGF